MQPKQYTNPKIALLNIELELKAERENAEIRLESVEVRISWFKFCNLRQVESSKRLESRKLDRVVAL